MTADASFEVVREGASAVRAVGSDGELRLIGELDMAGVDLVVRSLAQAEGHDGPITLDLSELTFIDGAGARVILQAARRRCLVLRSPSPMVLMVLRLVGGEQIPGIEIEP
jgi:anti-anti-sigma factor